MYHSAEQRTAFSSGATSNSGVDHYQIFIDDIDIIYANDKNRFAFAGKLKCLYPMFPSSLITYEFNSETRSLSGRKLVFAVPSVVTENIITGARLNDEIEISLDRYIDNGTEVRNDNISRVVQQRYLVGKFNLLTMPSLNITLRNEEVTLVLKCSGGIVRVKDRNNSFNVKPGIPTLEGIFDEDQKCEVSLQNIANSKSNMNKKTARDKWMLTVTSREGQVKKYITERVSNYETANSLTAFGNTFQQMTNAPPRFFVYQNQNNEVFIATSFFAKGALLIECDLITKVEECRIIVVQILMNLSVLHKNNIVYRNVTPFGVGLIDKQLGFVRDNIAFMNYAETRQFNQPHVPMNIPYAEYYTGKKISNTVTPRDDLFALFATMVFLLTDVQSYEAVSWDWRNRLRIHDESLLNFMECIVSNPDITINELLDTNFIKEIANNKLGSKQTNPSVQSNNHRNHDNKEQPTNDIDQRVYAYAAKVSESLEYLVANPNFSADVFFEAYDVNKNNELSYNEICNGLKMEIEHQRDMFPPNYDQQIDKIYQNEFGDCGVTLTNFRRIVSELKCKIINSITQKINHWMHTGDKADLANPLTRDKLLGLVEFSKLEQTILQNLPSYPNQQWALADWIKLISVKKPETSYNGLQSTGAEPIVHLPLLIVSSTSVDNEYTREQDLCYQRNDCDQPRRTINTSILKPSMSKNGFNDSNYDDQDDYCASQNTNDCSDYKRSHERDDNYPKKSFENQRYHPSEQRMSNNYRSNQQENHRGENRYVAKDDRLQGSFKQQPYAQTNLTEDADDWKEYERIDARKMPAPSNEAYRQRQRWDQSEEYLVDKKKPGVDRGGRGTYDQAGLKRPTMDDGWEESNDRTFDQYGSQQAYNDKQVRQDFEDVEKRGNRVSKTPVQAEVRASNATRRYYQENVPNSKAKMMQEDDDPWADSMNNQAGNVGRDVREDKMDYEANNRGNSQIAYGKKQNQAKNGYY